MYKVLLSASAKKELDDLPIKITARIGAVIDELRQLGIHAKNTKKLHPPIGGYRTRIGDYRILFDRNEDIIVIHHISKRADAY